MDSTTHVEEEKRELVKYVHWLVRLGVLLMDSTKAAGGDECDLIIISVRSETKAWPISYNSRIAGKCS